MDAILGILQNLGAFVGGIAARLGIVLLAMAAILVPALLVFGLLRGFAWARRRTQGLSLAGTVRYRPGLLYAPGHTWVRRERGTARVGVDDLAQKILPWAVSVRLPRPGTALQAGAPAAVISAGDREATIRAPLTGTVTAVNPDVVLEPSLVKSDAYARGWLFAMRPESDRIEGLRGEGEAQAWLAAEGERLNHWLETRLGIATADGGELMDPVAAHLDPQAWKDLTESFLR
jgi:glycine cleavage system H protein